MIANFPNVIFCKYSEDVILWLCSLSNNLSFNMPSGDVNYQKVDRAAERYAAGDATKCSRFRDKMDEVLSDAEDIGLPPDRMAKLVKEMEDLAQRHDLDAEILRKEAAKKEHELRLEIVREHERAGRPFLRGWVLAAC